MYCSPWCKKAHYNSKKEEQSQKWRPEFVLKHDEFFGDVLSKEFTALSNKIMCQTASSVYDSPALIIFPYFISSLKPTLTVFFGVFFLCEWEWCPTGMLCFQESIHAWWGLCLHSWSRHPPSHSVKPSIPKKIVLLALKWHYTSPGCT